MIVELGATWPSSLVARGGGCRVIAEKEGEGPLGFAARVDDFVTAAFPRSVQVARAVVACNQRADQTAEAARRAVAESLLGRLGGGGLLLFAATDLAGERFRRRLLDLVAELSGAAGRSGRIHTHLSDDDGRASGPRTSEAAPPLEAGKVARVA
ncbi:MAG TPA: hypothetical protein VGQ57_05085 [Polyangiaceae bacterium]|nr:hypothetical protein [Polyangiaceae bacterium]